MREVDFDACVDLYVVVSCAREPAEIISFILISFIWRAISYIILSGWECLI